MCVYASMRWLCELTLKYMRVCIKSAFMYMCQPGATIVIIQIRISKDKNIYVCIYIHIDIMSPGI